MTSVDRHDVSASVQHRDRTQSAETEAGDAWKGAGEEGGGFKGIYEVVFHEISYILLTLFLRSVCVRLTRCCQSEVNVPHVLGDGMC